MLVGWLCFLCLCGGVDLNHHVLRSVVVFFDLIGQCAFCDGVFGCVAVVSCVFVVVLLCHCVVWLCRCLSVVVVVWFVFVFYARKTDSCVCQKK